MKYLITPSLYNAWYWYKKLESSTKEDFLNTLNKVPFPQNENMLAGIKFEDEIKDYNLGNPSENECVVEFGNILKGAYWQEVVKKDLSFGDYDLLLYGKIDAVKLNKIYDIKFTKNYDIGKYEYSIQHLLYMYCSGIKDFEYLVSNGRETYKEAYSWDETSLNLLQSRIANMLSDIFANAEFKAAFNQFWQAQGR